MKYDAITIIRTPFSTNGPTQIRICRLKHACFRQTGKYEALNHKGKFNTAIDQVIGGTVLWCYRHHPMPGGESLRNQYPETQAP
jgi:hypothetical protein